MGNTAYNYWKFYNPKNPLNVMVIGSTKCESDYYVRRSSSRIMAIEYIKKGTGTLYINGKTYSTNQNSAIVLTKNSSHEYFSDKNDPMEKQWIVFDGQLGEFLLHTYLPPEEYCFANCNLSYHFEEIARIQQSCAGNYEKMTDNIAVVLHRMFIRIKNTRRNDGSDLAQQLRKYLDDNVETRLTIAELCKTFSYSKNQIIKVFNETYGMPPYRYFLEKKIEIAKLYLVNTQFSIGEIAKLLAFSDQNYFSAEFKRITSFSPSAFRKNMHSQY